MLKAKTIGLWFAILGIGLAAQGCWDEDEDRLALLGEGGCRTADDSAGDPEYLSGLSLEACKAQCFNGNGSCVAVEYNSNNSNCEIHSDPITKIEYVKGVSCYLAQ